MHSRNYERPRETYKNPLIRENLYRVVTDSGGETRRVTANPLLALRDDLTLASKGNGKPTTVEEAGGPRAWLPHRSSSPNWDNKRRSMSNRRELARRESRAGSRTPSFDLLFSSFNAEQTFAQAARESQSQHLEKMVRETTEEGERREARGERY